MKPQAKQIVTVLCSIFLFSCSAGEISPENNNIPPPVTTPPPVTETPTTPIAKTIKYLALGDSYTIGQSVCETCRYPEQLKARLQTTYPETDFSLNVIATTGWTTSDLISAIKKQNPEANYDLVTLLIGVNNQFQHIDFSVYEDEFYELLNKAIVLAKGDNKKVIVISIPDYAYTPFAKNYTDTRRAEVSADIDKYNQLAESYCISKKVTFISITDITRRGLTNSNLVAEDGLHPSEMAYNLFVDRMLPEVKKALQN